MKPGFGLADPPDIGDELGRERPASHGGGDVIE
jgi:hypothetical protein